jgi:hypothetical protein
MFWHIPVNIVHEPGLYLLAISWRFGGYVGCHACSTGLNVYSFEPSYLSHSGEEELTANFIRLEYVNPRHP